jgi:hypothetical protein
MQYYPHRNRKNSIQGIILALIATVILMASMGCKKTKPSRNPEPPPADLKTRELVKRMVYPQHGQGCDTAMNGRY